MLGEDEPDWLAGANCGGCKSRATKRSKRSFVAAHSSCPPPRLYQVVPPACTSAGNAADVTTARLERSLLRLGTWQEGKRSVPQATWFLPLLLFAPLLLALCAVPVHVFLDGWTKWPLPSCQVGRRDEPFAAVLSLAAVACGQCTVFSEEFQIKTNAPSQGVNELHNFQKFCMQQI